MTDIHEILDRLHRVRRLPDGQWLAQCPAHDDDRASLGVAVSDTGKLLLCCYAGCKFVDIANALGIRSTGKFAVPAKQKSDSRIFEASYYAAMSLPWPVTHGWSYVNKDGSHAFAVYRLDNNGKKEIRPVKPVDGGYAFGLPPTPRPIYNLKNVACSTGILVIAEGERAADAISDAGWTATTSCGGASAYGHSRWNSVSHRRVIIWPDNDEPGLKYASAVAGILRDNYCEVSILEPFGGKGDDAADCDDVDSFLIGGL